MTDVHQSAAASTTSTDVAAANNPSMTEANYRELLDKFADQKKQKRTVETEKLKEI